MSEPVGNMIFVDAVFGNDTTGARQYADKPFLTVAAAMAVAQAGDIVYCWPGTYAVPVLAPTAGYSIIGAAKRRVIFTHTAVADTTLLTMFPGFSLREVELRLLSAGHHTLTGVLFNGATAQTSYLRSVRVLVDNSGAGAGASQVTGVLLQSTGAASITTPMVDSPVEVQTVGTGRKRGVLLDTSICEVNMQHVDVLVNAPASIDAIGVEVNRVGATLRHLSGVVDVTAAASPTTNADVSATAGDLYVSAAVNLRQHSCKGLAYHTPGQASDLAYGDVAGIPVGPVFLRRGAAASTTVEADAQTIFPDHRVVQRMTVHLGQAPGGVATCTVTVRKNGVDTALQVIITGAATSGSDFVHAVEYDALVDHLAVSASDTGASQDINVTMQAVAS